MANRMTEILQTATARPLFAIGLAHWIYGDSNLEILLEKEGYTLQRVEGMYDPALLPELSDAVCDSDKAAKQSISSSGVGASFPQNAGLLAGTVAILCSFLLM